MIEMTPIFLFVGSLILSGFYSGSEAALLSISLERMKQLVGEGGTKGKAIKFLSEHSSDILTTILVGNNVVNIFAASLTTTIAQSYFENDVIAISVGVTTLFILVFGEILPKTFARSKSEQLAVPIIRILQVNYYLFFPVVKIFMWIIKAILGKNVHLSGRVVTRDDIEFMVSQAEQEQSIDEKQIDLLNSILEFPTIKVKDIMVPRSDVHFIKSSMNFKEIISIIREVAHSRYPVFEDNMEEPLGFLHVKDLAFVTGKERADFDIKKFIKPPFFVYEHMKIQSVFDYMNRSKVHLSLVKDENGLIVGILTLEDIMEEIFGEILDEHDDAENIVQEEQLRKKEGVVVSGKMSIRDLNSDFNLGLPQSDNYSTLTGFLLESLGNEFPKRGNMIYWEGLSFELSDVSNKEIQEVTIRDVSGHPVIKKNDSETVLATGRDSSSQLEKVAESDMSNLK